MSDELDPIPGLPEGAEVWTAESARRDLPRLKGKIAVVQVDVFDRVPWGVAQADEYWQASRLAGESAIDFALRSRREAVAWIEQFPRQEVLYVIEFSAQDDTAEGIRIQRRA